jgi:hypothetical protein
MELITMLSGLLKATEDRPQFSLRSNLISLSGPSSAKPITHTIRVALNPTPFLGCDSFIKEKIVK